MKKITILFFLLALISNTQAQTQGKVEGVITYFFNKYQGDKPDLGSKIIVLDSINSSGIDVELIKSFNSTKMTLSTFGNIKKRYDNYDLLVEKTKGKKKLAEDYEKYLKLRDEAQLDYDKYFDKLKKLNIETKEGFSKYDSKVYGETLKFINNKNIIEKTVDGNGNYSIDLTPGTYYVFIRSKNRDGLSMTEIKGQIHFEKVIVKEKKSNDVSHNFEVGNYIYE